MLDETEKLPEENEENLKNQKTENLDKADKVDTKPKEVVEIDSKPEVEKEVTEEIKVEKNTSSNKAIDEIENKIAESSEGSDHEEIEVVDYSKFTLEELVDQLTSLVKNQPVQSINENVNKIKKTFNSKFGALIKSEKEKFLAAGGNTIDFHYQNPIKTTYNSILYDFKIKRAEFFKNQENKLNENLDIKLEVIEQLKHLVDNAHGGDMYKNFKALQDRWRETGPIPRAKYNDTWRTYHHHVERFYDLLHMSNDLRELDFKHNLDEKLKLVEKAEELDKLEDINEAFKELQVLHKLWKEDIGPVAREHREKVWDQFSEATKKIHDKRHEHYKSLKSKFEGNIDKKLAVIAEIEALDTSKNNSRSDWQKSINEIEKLREKFFAVGQVPRAKSDEIWNKFKNATKKFNAAKNLFFKDLKKDYLENLNKKKALIEKAIALKDSEDWDSTTEVMKKIQSDWKKIGHVPRKYSDKLWKEFKDACNYYFDRLHNKQDEGNKEQVEILNKKKDLLSTIKNTIDNKVEIDLETLKDFVTNWRSLGRVPYEMRHIEMKFNKMLDKIASENKIDKEAVEMVKFENLVNSYLEQGDFRKLDSEQMFVRKKIDETNKEIQQLENNIGFISNVSDDNPLLKNVRNQIDSYKETLEIWVTKLNYLRQLEY
ncbi:DUF349 domain-containing protein [Lutibacter sp. TH_r2]|uniref:DUF349 domain-containing protein n=1 Tax=Lutibacter sp. TH_r2 TaxID=3082083 RepID=UPI002952A5EA|nr:DUF349 domain-containing protein [Lutibacter sp. TH_r2]MDV7187177.1 DUF349 domain-containing protein [Lutibacter sp. TH_r2]